VLKICWGNLVSFDKFFDIATIPIVLTSHNMATRQNTIIDQILKMTIVLTKDNDVWYITLLAPNKLLRAFVLEVELDSFLDVIGTLSKVNSPIGLEIMSMWDNLGIKLHHVKGLTHAS
jgi:hypothetical protein